MLAITGIGASFAEEADYDGAAWVICCFFGLSLLVLMCAAAFGIHVRFGRKASFSFFISHHKSGEGALARQLQMQLADNPCTRGRVFIDSDELQHLDTLFEYAQREWHLALLVMQARVCECARGLYGLIVGLVAAGLSGNEFACSTNGNWHCW